MTRPRTKGPLGHVWSLVAGHVMTLHGHGPHADAADAVTVAVAVPVASVPNLIKLAEKCSGMKLFVRPERERQTNSLR